MSSRDYRRGVLFERLHVQADLLREACQKHNPNLEKAEAAIAEADSIVDELVALEEEEEE